MSRNKKPRKPHRTKIVRVPMMSDTHKTMATTVHLYLEAAINAPSIPHFNNLVESLWIAETAIGMRPRHMDHESIQLTSMRNTLNGAVDRIKRTGNPALTEREAQSLRHAVTAIDSMLSKLDLTTIHQAQTIIDHEITSWRKAA